MITYKNFAQNFEIAKKNEKNRILYTAIYAYASSNDQRFTYEELNKLFDSISANLSNLSRGRQYIKESKDLREIKKDYYTLTAKALNNYSKIVDFLIATEEV